MIQAYNTTALHLLLSRPLLHSVYLVKEGKGAKVKETPKWKYIKLAGQIGLALTVKKGIDFVRAGGKQTYLGLILVWAIPFLWLLWSLAYQFLVNLPLTTTLLPIIAPTAYLCVVDTLALKRGAWVIDPAIKTGWTLWPGLEIEEALFFVLTNCLIVAGLVAFDNALAILNTFPAHFPNMPSLPSPALLVRALLVPASTYDDDRIAGIQQSVDRLRDKSRSFYLASSAFQGRLRIDLTILYSFCRAAGDLIDNAKDAKEAREWIGKLRSYVDLSYSQGHKNPDGTVIPATDRNQGSATIYVVRNFPPETVLALLFLPTQRLSKEPLYGLLRGLEMDLDFSRSSLNGPIKSESDLDLYGSRVAGTVGQLCIQLVLFHYQGVSEPKAKRLMTAGHDMGIALQYINIARDLSIDAENGRVYVPSGWLKKEKLAPESFITCLRKMDDASDESDGFFVKKVENIRSRLLDRAFSFYEESVGAINDLPRPALAPMRVAVESYVQMGRELRKPGFKIKEGRATVPKLTRLWIGWRALLGPIKQ